MFRITFLRSILLYSLVIAVFLPLYNALIIYPSYQDILVRETEEDAARHVDALLRMLKLEGQPLTRERLAPELVEEIRRYQNDPRLVKLRIFSPDGEIIYSSDPAEEGQRNAKPYFHEQVARGIIYSKVVESDSRTAEDRPIAVDVVETYVPLMARDLFLGAVETYLDISASHDRLLGLTRQSTLVMLVISAGLLLAILGVMKKAHSSIREREKAEAALQMAMDDLERRVTERTQQLLEANQQLNAEIAERRRAENSLIEAFRISEEAKEKIDGILRSVPDGLLVTDSSDRVLLMNATAERLLGVSLHQALGRGIEEILDDQALLGELQRGAGRQFDFQHQDPRRQILHHYRARTSVLVGRDHLEKGMIVLFQDVSREQEIDRMKNEFLAMTTHELKTPLAGIMGYAELLLDGGLFDPTPNQRREFLGTIYQSAEALARLVDDILDVSRLASGKPLGLEHSPFFMEELLKDALARFRERYPGHRIELRLAETPTRIVADRGRLFQVLNNLVSNAVKFSPRGSLVELAGERCGESYRLSVSDQGVGLTPDQVGRIFDKFYRADTSDTAVRGTGLGLSIVKHILEAHDGGISVDSRPMQGTRVEIQLPLRPREAGETPLLEDWPPLSSSA
ncbi:hypothetical protein DESUT3_04070 [Desulfuromonas versatilis]|uniref:histidine kinase n=1 Tax=Desulfuromonas versatilis TaxID=2802975 RepID=A0ABN6DT64_9BACT|nr:ATP-binding protein [Desulfuromonas versatilis]BCR03338.1 hypothetical protein DESUT3_04070 [Desulfuromonas versatilis]